ncbi:MAG: translocation/assembly module TamB [candidate division WOR-3 bacterium]|nr:translocation/assembly module TamB [candidate division WOR-3 bacterium]
MNKLKKIICIFTVIVFVIGIFLLENKIKKYIYDQYFEILNKVLNVKIKFKKFDGNLINNIRLNNIEINLKSGGKISIDQLYCSYDILSYILKKTIVINKLTLINPKFLLNEYSTYTTNSIKEKKIPNLRISKIIISNGQFVKSHNVVIDSLLLQCSIEINSNTIKVFLLDGNLKFYQQTNRFDVLIVNGAIEITSEIIRFKKFFLNINQNNFLLSAEFINKQNALKVNLDKASIKLSNLFRNCYGEIVTCGNIDIIFDNENFPSVKINFAKIKFNIRDLLINNIKLININGDLECENNKILVNMVCANKSDTLNLSMNTNINWNAFHYYGKTTYTLHYQNKKKVNQTESWVGTLAFKGKYRMFLICNFNMYNSVTFESIITSIRITSLNRPKIFEITIQNFLYALSDGFIRIKGQGNWQRSLKTASGEIILKNFNLRYIQDKKNLLSIIYSSLPDWDLSGYLTGELKFKYQKGLFNSHGELGFNKLKIYDITIDRSNLQYTISNLENKMMLNLTVNNIYIPNIFKRIHNLKLFIKNEHFTIQIDSVLNNLINCTGLIGLTKNKLFAEVTSLVITNQHYLIQNLKNFYIGITDTLIFLNNLSIVFNSGQLQLEILKTANQPLAMDLSGSRVPIEDVCILLNLPFRIKGKADFTIQCGSFIKSERNVFMTCKLNAQDVQFPYQMLHNTATKIVSENYLINIKNIIWDCELTDRKFIINTCRLVYRRDTSQLNGYFTIPCENFCGSLFDFTWIKNISEIPLLINVHLSDPGAWILFFLKDIIDVKDAKIYGSGQITGTLNSPVFNGSVDIDDGVGEIVLTHTQYYGLNAQLYFNDKFISVNINAHSRIADSTENNITAQGTLRLANFTKLDSFFVSINFRNVPIQPHKEFFAVINGEVVLSSQYKTSRNSNLLSLHGNVMRLVIKGNIAIKEALITTEFGSSSGVSVFTDSNVIFDLKVTGERDVWLRNSITDCEFRVNLSIISEESGSLWVGELQAIQGNVYYLDHTLTLTRGVIVFDNIPNVNPLINISAELLTRPIHIARDFTKPIKIILNLSGRFKEPQFSFSSDPPYLNEVDILSYLNFNVSWQEMTAMETREVITRMLSNKLIGYFERELSKRIREKIFFEYFWIESGLLSENGVKISFGKYIGSKLYINYEYTVTSDVYDVFRIEYYLKKNHMLVGERNETGNYRIFYQYNIRY